MAAIVQHKPLNNLYAGKLVAVDRTDKDPCVGLLTLRKGTYGILQVGGGGYKAISTSYLREPTQAERLAYETAASEIVHFKKGDVVTFQYLGEAHRGVISGFAKASGLYSVDVGTMRYRLGGGNLTKSTSTVGDAGAMAPYSLTSYKECKFASEETICFEATICVGPVAFAVVGNDGKGGSNNMQPLGNASSFDRRATVAEFAKAVNTLAMKGDKTPSNYPNEHALQNWIDWSISAERKMGASLVDFARTRNEELEAFLKDLK